MELIVTDSQVELESDSVIFLWRIPYKYGAEYEDICICTYKIEILAPFLL